MTSENHFLTFHIENFKRFDEFTLENLGQFNVIVGDNNVGKSSVLEALMFEKDYEKFLNNLGLILYNFKHFDGLKDWFMLQYFKTNAKKNSDTINFTLKLANLSEIKVDLVLFANTKIHRWRQYYGNATNFFANPLTGNNNFANHNQINFGEVPYIPFQLSYTHEITDFYSKNIQPRNSRKEQFLKDLQTIIPDISNLEINTVVANQPVILISRKSADSNLPLGTYGDGVIKLFRILIEMQIHAGKRLMIDEIDTGIHFSRMKIFWKTVILSARNNNVQLFATTHSDECLKCYKEALEELGEDYQKDARMIHMEETDPETQQVKAYTYKYNEFGHSIEIGNELR